MSAAVTSNAGLTRSVRDFDENDSIVHLVFTPRTKPRRSADWRGVGAILIRTSGRCGTSGHTAVSQPGYGTGHAVFRFNHREGRRSAWCVPIPSSIICRGTISIFRFLIGGTYIYSPNLQLVLGVSVDIERKYPVLSLLRDFAGKSHRNGFSTPCCQHRVSSTEMSKDLSLYVGANMKQTSYRVDDDFGDTHGIPEAQSRDPHL